MRWPNGASGAIYQESMMETKDDLTQYVVKRVIVEELQSPFGTHYRVIISESGENGNETSGPMDSEADALRFAAKHLGAASWVKSRVRKS